MSPGKVITLGEVADLLGCTLDPAQAALLVKRISSPENADETSITFLSHARMREQVQNCAALAVIVACDSELPGKILLPVDDPYVGYARVARLFEPMVLDFGEQMSATATIASGAKLDPTVSVGPGTVIADNVCIGPYTRIGANVTIERNVSIGAHCRIHSGVVLCRRVRVGEQVIIESGAVIGSEGFANARRRDGSWVRIPSLGSVEIGDGCWIGANSCIDRASFGTTRLCNGARIDNLVHLAHNVEVGENTAIAAQTGIAGSTRVGRRVLIGGQAGFIDHISIGDDCFIGAKAGVSKQVEAGSKVTGYPARDFMTMRRIEAAQLSLPRLLKDVKKLQRDRRPPGDGSAREDHQ